MSCHRRKLLQAKKIHYEYSRSKHQKSRSLIYLKMAENAMHANFCEIKIRY